MRSWRSVMRYDQYMSIMNRRGGSYIIHGIDISSIFLILSLVLLKEATHLPFIDFTQELIADGRRRSCRGRRRGWVWSALALAITISSHSGHTELTSDFECPLRDMKESQIGSQRCIS